RTRVFNKESYLNPIFTTTLTLFSILVLILAYFRIMSNLKVSNRLTRELEEANNKLGLMNDELQSSQGRFLKMFDNNPVALSFAEVGTNKIVYANKLFYSYFGYTPEEVI